MVYNTEFKSLVSAKEKFHITPNKSKESFRQWNKEKEELASKATKFGGRRLLGVTDNNIPIYASYEIDKETLTLTLKLSHSIDTIRNSKYCPRRITLGINEPLNNLDFAMREASKLDHGAVTDKTIRYLEKLMTMVESGSIGKVNGQCSSQLFMYVSNFLYEGSTEQGKFRWHDVMKTWNFPNGAYFTVYG